MASPLERYQSLFDDLLTQPIYGLKQTEKARLLAQILTALHNHHCGYCLEYRNITGDWSGGQNEEMDALPYLAVRLFKHLALQSIEQQQVFKVLQSSGTSGQSLARIFLDRDTSARQSKVLVKILQQDIGKQRLPMLIIDSPTVLQDKQLFSARGAGIQGLAFFGRDHTYALDENMQPNWPAIEAFCEAYGGQPVLLFGFTFMVWLYFVEQLYRRGRSLQLPQGVLLHSGGWKKLESARVDNKHFKAAVTDTTGISRIHNFYGMAEQVGSVFVECEQGHLHCPVFADLIVRDPYSLQPCETGQTGIVQVLSALPTSYPGHSLLTEDLGAILGIDNCPCGRKGKYFRLDGRLPKTDVRGCSDTHKVA